MVLLGFVAGLSLLVQVARGNTTPAGQAKCPLQASSTIPPGDAWAFHETGVPTTTSGRGIASSYTHGRGGWGGGRGSGTICEEDLSSSGPPHNIVFTVAGSSHVSPRVTRLGHLGAALVLNGSVTASDDPTCLVGARGTVTLFASYYEGHHDSLQLHFANSCMADNATFGGPQLYVVIANNGHQVN